MPNHVTHRVVVTGPEKDLKKFRTEHIVRSTRENGSEGDEYFDFNLVIPMPETLKGTKSPPPSSYKAWYGTDSEVALEIGGGYYRDKGLKTRKDLQNYLLRQDSKAKEEADQVQKNLDLYGFTDWYEWSCQKWGTKWNGYSFRWVEKKKDRLEFTFDTAWSPPLPIFKRISQMFSTLIFDVKSFDEGWNFGAEGEFKGGFESYEEKEATDELYETVYGEKPEKDEE